MILNTETWDLENKPLATLFNQFQKALAEENEKDMVLLFAAEGLINERFDGGDVSPLEYAVNESSAKMVELLLDLGANVDKGFRPPIAVAIQRNKFETLKVLLQKGARTTYHGDNHSYLNSCDSIECFRVLIDHIYAHNQQSEHNMITVANNMCRRNSQEFLEMVIEKTDDEAV
nr:hypothetical protein [Pseudomonadota bacterium]